MKPRPWQVRRQQIDVANAAQRWDHAYQALLMWTLAPPPDTNRNTQEATDAHCPVCAGLDPTPSPEPGT
jgi:hypothetical protein